MNPSSMSMLGVPYSPIVPSFTRWQSGTRSRIANSRLRVPITFVYWVSTAASRDRIENGAEGCSRVVDDRLRQRLGDHARRGTRRPRSSPRRGGSRLPGDLAPGLDPLIERADRGQRVGRVLGVPAATGEVVDDRHLVAARGEAHRGRPPQVPVATQDQDPHRAERVAAATAAASWDAQRRNPQACVRRRR